MIYRIAITGTESTGKTVLMEQLMRHYQTIGVPDQSRIYIDSLAGKPYSCEDVLQIAKNIIEQEDKMLINANRILFSDNDLVNIKIWLQYYNWQVPDWLEAAIEKHEADLYLLCDIDIEWEEDAQRKNQHDRVTLFYRFINALDVLAANYKFVSGHDNERLEMAIRHIDNFLRIRGAIPHEV